MVKAALPIPNVDRLTNAEKPDDGARARATRVGRIPGVGLHDYNVLDVTRNHGSALGDVARDDDSHESWEWAWRWGCRVSSVRRPVPTADRWRETEEVVLESGEALHGAGRGAWSAPWLHLRPLAAA